MWVEWGLRVGKLDTMQPIPRTVGGARCEVGLRIYHLKIANSFRRKHSEFLGLIFRHRHRHDGASRQINGGCGPADCLSVTIIGALSGVMNNQHGAIELCR